MAALESLPADQRAVLQLLVRERRSYADLAQVLKITPNAVRARAHAGVATLAGDGLPAEDAGRVSDYLLGQLDEDAQAGVRAELAAFEETRAWARSAAAGLTPLSGPSGVPDIPGGEADTATARPRRVAAPAPSAPSPDDPAPTVAPSAPSDTPRARDGDPPPSRLGGLALLGGVAILAAAIVLALVVNRGGGDPASTGTTPVGTTSTNAAGATGATGTSTSPQVQVLAQINLVPPAGGSSPLAVAQLVRSGSAVAFFLRAQGLTPPPGGHLSVWLTGARVKPLELVGIANTRIRKGSLTTVAPVPRRLGAYTTMLVTSQTGGARTPAPAPGTTVLTGAVKAPAGFGR